MNAHSTPPGWHWPYRRQNAVDRPDALRTPRTGGSGRSRHGQLLSWPHAPSRYARTRRPPGRLSQSRSVMAAAAATSGRDGHSLTVACTHAASGVFVIQKAGRPARGSPSRKSVAVRAQLLDDRRPGGLLEVVRHLTLVQIDPTAVIAPSADLVARSRLGSSYSPAEMDTALQDRALLELRAMIRPSEDLALHRADMAEWPGRGELRDWQQYQLDWVRANDACRRDILSRLERSGPLPSRDLPDTCQVPWASTGWTDNRNVTQLLEFMVRRGEVATAARRGRDRLWALPARVSPDDPG